MRTVKCGFSAKRLIALVMSVVLLATSFTVVSAIPSMTAKAATNVYEVFGNVTADPVIYIHGDYTGSMHNIDDQNQFDHMMKGSTISDGSYTGEYYTAFSSAKSISKMEAYTLSYNKITDLSSTSINSWYDGKTYNVFTGDLGTTFASVTSGFVLVKFTFTDGQYEYHKFPVRTNPVAEHTVASTFNYWQYYLNQYRDSISFEALAWGSDGSLTSGESTPSSFTNDSNTVVNMNSGAFDYSTTNDMKNVVSGTANFPVMYHPYSEAYDTWETNYVTYCDSMSPDQGPGAFDKKAGYFVGTNWNKNGERTAYVSSPYANYYFDKSTDRNWGITNTPGSDNYSLKIFVGGTYWNGNLNEFASNTRSVNEVKVNSTNGTTMSVQSMDSSIDNIYMREDRSGFATLGGVAQPGITTASYALRYDSVQHKSGLVKGQLFTNIKLYVSDKTTQRATYKEYVDKFDTLRSNCYTAASFLNFRNALLNLESYLSDNTLTTAGTNYINSLASAFKALKIDTSSSVHTVGGADSYMEHQPEVTATCTQAGTTGDWVCPHCGHTYAGTVTPATGHDYHYTSTTGGTATYVCTNDTGHSFTADVTAYNALKEQVDKIDLNKYSGAEVSNAYDTFMGVLSPDTKYVDDSMPQGEIDASITALISAINTANYDENQLSTYMVEAYVNGTLDQDLTDEFNAEPARYNEVKEYSISGSTTVVTKWDVVVDGQTYPVTNITGVRSMEFSISHTATTVKIYITTAKRASGLLMVRGYLADNNLFSANFVKSGGSATAVGNDLLIDGDIVLTAPEAPDGSVLKYWTIGSYSRESATAVIEVGGAAVSIGTKSTTDVYPHYVSKANYTVQVIGGTVTAYDKADYSDEGKTDPSGTIKAAYRQSMSLESNTAGFRAWALKTGESTYEIVAYTPYFEFVCEGTSTYIALTSAQVTEYKPQIRLRNADQAQAGIDAGVETSTEGVFISNVNGYDTLSVFGQLVVDTEDTDYTVKDCGIIINNTGANLDDFKIGDAGVRQGSAANRLESGQFTVTARSNKGTYNKFAVRGYITYSYTYGSGANAVEITVTDYTPVKVVR